MSGIKEVLRSLGGELLNRNYQCPDLHGVEVTVEYSYKDWDTERALRFLGASWSYKEYGFGGDSFNYAKSPIYSPDLSIFLTNFSFGFHTTHGENMKVWEEAKKVQILNENRKYQYIDDGKNPSLHIIGSSSCMKFDRRSFGIRFRVAQECKIGIYTATMAMSPKYLPYP